MLEKTREKREWKTKTTKQKPVEKETTTRLHRHDRVKMGGEEEKDVNDGPQVLCKTRPHFIPRDH